jgi:hypothetical protein
LTRICVIPRECEIGVDDVLVKRLKVRFLVGMEAVATKLIVALRVGTCLAHCFVLVVAVLVGTCVRCFSPIPTPPKCFTGILEATL